MLPNVVIPLPLKEHTRVVLLSRRGEDSLAPQHRRRLMAMAEVRAHRCERAPTGEQASALLADAEVLAATNACLPVLDDDLLERLPRLRAVVLFATGHDGLDLVVLRRHRVALVAVPDYATISVAEHALGLVLAMTSRLHLANNRSTGLCPPGVSLRGVEVAGRTVCVVGLGRIGRHVAGLLSALGARVVGCDPDPAARQRVAAVGVECVAMLAGLAVADIVVVAASREFGAPALLGREQLALMPAHAFLINVGRKELVDTAAALEALRGERLRGYAQPVRGSANSCTPGGCSRAGTAPGGPTRRWSAGPCCGASASSRRWRGP
jgi:phosphoglycerate dehydrogenase-like enzyme